MKLEQAARALLAHWDTPAWKYLKPTGDLMADLREALVEQAEQEPVGYVPQSVINWLSSDERTEGAYSSINLYKNPCGSSDVPLYAAPVRTKDLTDDEIVELIEKHWDLQRSLPDFACAVIAADREKNK